MSFDLRLVRYGLAGHERPGLIDIDGKLRDLSYVLIDIQADQLNADDLDILRSIEPATLPTVAGAPPFAIPLTGIGRTSIDGVHLPDISLLPTANTPLDGAPRNGVAAVVGGPGFIAGYMAARVNDERTWATLAPQLLITDRPADHESLAANDRRTWQEIAAALTPPPEATAGDVIISLSGRPRDSLMPAAR